MKNSTILLSFFISWAFLLSSCTNDINNDSSGVLYQCPMKCENDKTYTQPLSCPVCKMDLRVIDENQRVVDDQISGESIFNLTSKWKNQNDETIELYDLKGDVLVMVMIYTTCKAACPRLVADMRSIYEEIDDANVKYVLVSIDPETDTPERLKAFAIQNQMDNNQWIFLQGNPDDVREFSNVLSVKYKQISPLDFSHSNIISVFDQSGVLVHQQEGLGVNNEATVAEIIELTKQKK